VHCERVHQWRIPGGGRFLFAPPPRVQKKEKRDGKKEEEKKRKRRREEEIKELSEDNNGLSDLNSKRKSMGQLMIR